MLKCVFFIYIIPEIFRNNSTFVFSWISLFVLLIIKSVKLECGVMNEQEMKTSKIINDGKRSISQFRSKLEDVFLNDIIHYWQTHNNKTIQYKRTIDELLKANIIPLTFADQKPFTVGGFRHINHQTVLDYVRHRVDWDRHKKERIMTCYTDLIKWLDGISYGWFRDAVNSYQMSLHAMEKTLTFSEWRAFIDILCEKNPRDGLIARVLLQGQRRVSEVLNLTLDQIDFDNNTIHYETKGKSELVSYEMSFMKELQKYVNETNKLRSDKQFVFLTRTGEQVTRLRLNYSFARVCELARIKKISPDYLRGIYKMFIQQRYKEKDIMYSKKARTEQTRTEIDRLIEECF